MPARRKSLQALEMSGQLSKNPGRYATRKEAPRTGDLGNPPRSLTKSEAAIWREIKKSSPAGVLQKRDRFAVEMTCRLIARARTGLAKASELSILSSLLGKLALTPTDSNRIEAPPAPREPDAFDELMLEMRQHRERDDLARARRKDVFEDD